MLKKKVVPKRVKKKDKIYVYGMITNLPQEFVEKEVYILTEDELNQLVVPTTPSGTNNKTTSTTSGTASSTGVKGCMELVYSIVDWLKAKEETKKVLREISIEA